VENVRSGEHVLNVSFGTFVTDRTGNRAGRVLLGEGELADVTIQLDDGTSVAAHEVILTTRCEFFRMLLLRWSDGECEGGRKLVRLTGVPPSCAAAILEFLYVVLLFFCFLLSLGGYSVRACGWCGVVDCVWMSAKWSPARALAQMRTFGLHAHNYHLHFLQP